MSGGSDGTVRFWDAATGAQIGEPLRGHEGWVYSVAFSADGRRIVSGGEDRTLRLWDITGVFSSDIVNVVCDQLKTTHTTELEAQTGLEIGQVCTEDQRRFRFP